MYVGVSLPAAPQALHRATSSRRPRWLYGVHRPEQIVRWTVGIPEPKPTTHWDWPAKSGSPQRVLIGRSWILSFGTLMTPWSAALWALRASTSHLRQAGPPRLR